MLDKIVIEIDKVVKTLATKAVSDRVHPDAMLVETELTADERKHAMGLMRINHCGEICAQGLYQGQSLTSRNPANKAAFEHAAFQETEHLAWTMQRVTELGGRASLLNPFFYLGSLSIGVGAGLIGDKWNLGFLEETEVQVGQHLADHLEQLPKSDAKSRAIVAQMKIDEAQHAEMAHYYGAAKLPAPVKAWMRMTSSIMTRLTYYI